MKALLHSLAMTLCLGTIPGCGQPGIDMGQVSGKVTWKGAPLPFAKVQFQPGNARPSYAITTETGEYRLRYSLSEFGARQGDHQVYITMAPLDEVSQPGAIVPKIKIPRRYNESTELTATVNKGKNRFDFHLTE